MKTVIDLTPYVHTETPKPIVGYRRPRRFGSLSAAIEGIVTLMIAGCMLAMLIGFVGAVC